MTVPTDADRLFGIKNMRKGKQLPTLNPTPTNLYAAADMIEAALNSGIDLGPHARLDLEVLERAVYLLNDGAYWIECGEEAKNIADIICGPVE